MDEWIHDSSPLVFLPSSVKPTKRNKLLLVNVQLQQFKSIIYSLALAKKNYDIYDIHI